VPGKILIPLDGSKLSVCILADVRRLLADGEGHVELFSVVASDELASSAQRKRRRELEVHTEELAKDDINASIRVVISDDPASAILVRAKEMPADLIALATHGRSGVSRWVRGSVAERVLRNANVPVLLVNPPEKRTKRLLAKRDGQSLLESGDGFQRLLVPVDGSQRSGEVLELVTVLALAYQARVTLLYVTPSETDDGAAVLAAPRAALEERGLTVTTRIETGDPADRILKAISDSNPQLVMMATHGRSGVERWRFGSVTEKVLRACPCPILVHRKFEEDATS